MSVFTEFCGVALRKSSKFSGLVQEDDDDLQPIFHTINRFGKFFTIVLPVNYIKQEFLEVLGASLRNGVSFSSLLATLGVIDELPRFRFISHSFFFHFRPFRRKSESLLHAAVR